MKSVTYDETQWQLVPVGPTPEMMNAGLMAAVEDGISISEWLRDTIYKAMIAAAPQQPIAPSVHQLMDAARQHGHRLTNQEILDRIGSAMQPHALSAASVGWDAQFLALRLGRVAALVGVKMPDMSYEDTADVAGTILGQIAAKLEAQPPAVSAAPVADPEKHPDFYTWTWDVWVSGGNWRAEYGWMRPEKKAHNLKPLYTAPQQPDVSAEPSVSDGLPLGFAIFRNDKQVGIELTLRQAQRWVDAEIVPLYRHAATPPRAINRDAVLDAVAESLGDLYCCTRVWSAWSYGTMSEDDFHPAAEDNEIVSSITDAAIAAMQKGGA